MKIFRSLVLFTALSGALALNSCSKKSTPAPVTTVNYITVNIDGVATNFNVTARAVAINQSGTTLTSISGKSSAGEVFGIQLGALPVAGKTYSDTSSVTGEYPFFAYSQGADAYSNDDDNLATSPVVTFTTANSKMVAGTFSGTLTTNILGTTAAPKLKSFTGGKFSVSY